MQPKKLHRFEENDFDTQNAFIRSQFSLPADTSAISRANEVIERGIEVVGEQVVDDSNAIMEAFLYIEKKGLAIDDMDEKYKDGYKEFLESISTEEFLNELNDSLDNVLNDLKQPGDKSNEAGFKLFLAVSMLRALSRNGMINENNRNYYEVTNILRKVNQFPYSVLPMQDESEAVNAGSLFRKFTRLLHGQKPKKDEPPLLNSISTLKRHALGVALNELDDPDFINIYLETYITNQFAAGLEIRGLGWVINDLPLNTEFMKRNHIKRALLTVLESNLLKEKDKPESKNKADELKSCINSFQLLGFTPETPSDRSLMSIAQLFFR